MSIKYSESTEFICLYPLSKTVRNELIPMGRTKEYIMKEGILTEDEARAETYKKIKLLIDDYHRKFIDDVLSRLNLEWDSLVQAVLNYRKSVTDENKKKMTEIQTAMRKQIAREFTDNTIYKKMFGKEMFSEILPKYILSLKDNSVEEKDEWLANVKMFDKFSTYFTNFNDNRKNVYSADDKAGTIAYRIIHQNLMFFMDNINAYNTILGHMPELIENIEKECEDILDGWTLKQIFSVDFYNNAVSQAGITYYNEITGYVNKCGNLYCQKNDEASKYARLIKMKPLYKQILSTAASRFEIPKKLQSDEEARNMVMDFARMIADEKISDRIVLLADSIKDMDISRIYVKTGEMTHISMTVYSDWNMIDSAIKNNIIEKYNNNDNKKKKKVKKSEAPAQFSLEALYNIMENYHKNTDDNTGREIEKGPEKKLEDYFLYVRECAVNIKDTEKNLRTMSFEKIRENGSVALGIKEQLDKYLKVFHALKPFQVSDELDKNAEFYSEFDVIMSELNMIVKIYNMMRNYATMKPYSDEKVKLNFKNPTLADGWDKNKERDNTAIILLKDDKYYLGVMNAKNKPRFVTTENSEGAYKKMVYKLLPGPNKMLPKVFFSKKGIENYNPPERILEGYMLGKHKKGENFDRQYCMELIDWFKAAINRHEDWRDFGFKFSATESYQDISGFYREVEQQGYKITYEYISETDIDRFVDEGKLYLFQIYNKDFAKGKTGKDNLHTMYLKACFDEDNLRNVVYKLNGEAELFYRKRSIDKPFVHKEGSVLINKWTNEKNARPVPDKIYKELDDYYNKGKKDISEEARAYLPLTGTRRAAYDIVKDKRYTVDKFFFHLPITVNFKAKNINNINNMVCRYLRSTEDIRYIGIDRGERNLLYVTLIDKEGNILQQKNFNIVNNYNYKEKLTLKEKDRDNARKNWTEVGKIAELKEGYLSTVINKIVEMMLENNAVIVMEDLNFGFKRGRFKFERQVYQKFENMLISKLNFIVSKSADKNQVTGLLKGLQLSNSVSKLSDVGKQCGFIFYIPASFTSKIDPTTGFVQVFDFKKITGADKIREFFGKFEAIRYNEKNDIFEFTFDYGKFQHFQTLYQMKWTVGSYGERIKNKKDIKTSVYSSENVNMTEKFKEILADISYENEADLKTALEELDNSKIREFFEAFKLMLQMRNSETGGELDYILSPVKNDEGVYYDSRNYETVDGTGKLPENADANGAYHIALKGKCLIESIRELADENGEFDRKKLVMSNEKWFKYMQNQEYRG